MNLSGPSLFVALDLSNTTVTPSVNTTTEGNKFLPDPKPGNKRQLIEEPHAATARNASSTIIIPKTGMVNMGEQLMADSEPASKRQRTEDPDPEITLRVGDTLFHTRKSTLTESSKYFVALFSGSWRTAQSEDGTYFVDAEPNIFKHLLAYMRRGVLPIFYDKAWGFDHALYRELRHEAEFFLVEPLAQWVREGHYMKTVKVQHEMRVYTRANDGSGSKAVYEGIADADMETTFQLSHGTRNAYKCPLGIPSHNGDSISCRRPCLRLKAQIEGNGGTCYDDEKIVHVSVVTRKTVFQGLDEESGKLLSH